MKIVEINAVNFGSTGRIAKNLKKEAEKRGDKVLFCYPRSKSNQKNFQKDDVFIGRRIPNFLNKLSAKYLGRSGRGLFLSTWLFLRKVKKFNPDIIHLHNLHSDYINLPLLFRFIKKNRIKVVWTLHDCWSFTGHCPHFEMANCFKWDLEKGDGCSSGCSQYNIYPACVYDNAKSMYRLKRKWFTGVENLMIVTPSEWLKNHVKHSFLRDYPVEVVYNGIDLNVFKPTPGNFRETYSCDDKFVILGVSFGWGIRKGLDVFIELAKRLDSKRFQIVLVGTDEQVDATLPDNIISIHRTQDQKELAEIYSSADLFVNPTREEVFSLVTAEALACGTPALVFRTGGVPEVVDSSCGIIVEKNDVDGMLREINMLAMCQRFPELKCRERTHKFEVSKRSNSYITLYHNNNKKLQ